MGAAKNDGSELQRLHADLLDRREDPRGDAKRHTYEATKQVREALDGWLTDPRPGRMDFRHEDLLRLFLAEGSSNTDLRCCTVVPRGGR